MLVGVEDNSRNNIGLSASPDIAAIYAILGSGNDICMIVADSPEKLTYGNDTYGDFKAVVPMSFIDGEHQCTYTFTDSTTYITFGYKPTNKGCYSDVQFAGAKIYNWNTQWTRQDYNINGTGGAKTIDKTGAPVDLGDNITVGTQVVYDNSVLADRYYPRFTSNPRNALEIQRRNGTPNVSKVTTTIRFNTPVIPEFFISGIDTRYSQNDKVTITASCEGGVPIPVLTYASSERNSVYKIQGSVATANKNRSVSAADRNGTLNVSFQSGVTELVIEYVLEGSVTSLAQSIFISPITIRSMSPAPIINEDGLSFTKRVKSLNITTCDPVEYTFRIGNSNVQGKYVNFTDVLPDKMKWKTESVSLDTINSSSSRIKIYNDGKPNTLKIDSLFVPCSSEIIFKAIAKLDEDAPTDTYANRAAITYEQINSDEAHSRTLPSQDAETLEPFTAFTATLQQRQDTVKLEAKASSAAYKANREITVTLKVTNPNSGNITSMYLDLSWDAGFKYVESSYNNAAGSMIANAGSSPEMLSIAGDGNGGTGFTLPGGETIFTFKLLAPDTDNLEPEYDEQGQKTKNKAALNVSYLFSTTMDDPCMIESMNELSGILQTPHKVQKAHIIVNQNITTRIVR
jgi:hypothetical protein